MFALSPSNKPCLLCSRTEHRVAFQEFDVDILRCLHCGHVFSSYDADVHYEGYWGDEIVAPGEFYWDVAHGPMFDEFFRRYAQAPQGRLLDVGCGLGYFVRQATQKLPDWECRGVEISKTATAYAKENLGLSRIDTGLLEEVGYADASFDIVTLWDVLEHLKSPEPLLQEVLRILKPGGLCFMHTPNADLQLPKARLKRLIHGMKPDVHYLEAKDHLHLYTPKTARILLDRIGFSPVEVVHLPPIQSVAGGQGHLGRLLKNLFTQGASLLDRLSGGRLNWDNLFLAARRGAR